ncbi:phosphoenolpyruvate synthase [Candidatus Woesearchaeota archaeon]|nr:phosphoenolpyruvate synthase [Candidatus Woesearchaeota archaeon]
MATIAWFRDIRKDDLGVAGGKGANLGEMYNLRMPIPPGFVVTAQAFKKFLDEDNLGKTIFSLLKNLDIMDTAKLQAVAEKIQNLVLKAAMPKEIKEEIKESYETLNIDRDIAKHLAKNNSALSIIKAGRDQPFVAVRSSATAEDLPEASFAGQQATFLNIRGADPLVKAVQQCWASLYTARAIYYRAKNNFPTEKVLIAVVVQKMVNSDAAGVMFSINPSTNNPDEIMIEAAFGLGESVVGGEVTPDTYILDKATLKIKSKKIAKQSWGYFRDQARGGSVKQNLTPEKGSKQKLTDDEIVKLAQYALQLEEHYGGKPQDTEWALEGMKLHIVQTRAVTTFKKQAAVAEDYNNKEIVVEGLSASPGVGFGPVKIVHSLAELSKIEKGDVLVTKMTSPDMVAAMQKAVAIVTDEGGMTCFAGNTIILTDKGFKTIQEICDSQEEFLVPSLNRINLKIEWRLVIAKMKRQANTIVIRCSQTGKTKGSTLRLTPDHKMLVFKDREIVIKQIQQVLEEGDTLLAPQKIPKLEAIDNPDYRKAYVLGALMSDGYMNLTDRRGIVTFCQKECPEKKQFIGAVTKTMQALYQKEASVYNKIPSCGTIRGNRVISSEDNKNYTWHSKQIATELLEYKSSLQPLFLHCEEELIYQFLAGAIDGDGTFNDKSSRINIYCNDKKKILEATVLGCLRLGIVPQITVNRHIHNIQIVEHVEDILKFAQRVEGINQRKIHGTRFFSAKQLFGDIIDHVNYKGQIKPCVNGNLFIDSEKIANRVLPLCSDGEKKQITKILDSDVRAIRAQFVSEGQKEDVYNITVESNHNYVVFTDNLTPVIANNCHAAIVSREMGIPCVVGTEKATQLLQENEVITVDGSHGKVYKGATKVETKTTEEKNTQEIQQIVSSDAGDLITATKVYMNLGEPDQIEKYKNLPFDGIGLMRLEFIIISWVKKHPLALIKEGKADFYVDKLAEGIGTIAQAITPKPIVVRFSDFKTNEYKNLDGGQEFEPTEDNPMIGWRGVSRYISKEFEEAFRLECRSIKKLRDSGLTNVQVMLPFVRTTWEVEKCLAILKSEGLVRSSDFKIWLMAEVPAIALIPEAFAQLDIDGASIGSNDLTQGVLCVDRDSGKLGKMGYFDERNPAVLQAMKQIIRGFKKCGKTVSICGQSVSVYPEITEFLVREGITSISVSPDVVTKTRHLVATVERKIILEKIEALK